MRRFAGKSFPRVELELPGGNWTGWDMMHSYSTCTITGGGKTTILAARACSHCEGIPSVSLPIWRPKLAASIASW